MKLRFATRALLATALVAAFAALQPSALLPTVVHGGEPAREFLEELRSRRYYDVALDYLDQMETSPLAPVELKEVLDYERAVTLISGASYQRDLKLRERQLDQAQKSLERFIGQRANHTLISAAKGQLGNLLQKRASMAVERANAPGGGAQKATLMAQARQLYEKSHEVFETSKADLKARLQSMKKVYDPKTEKEELDRLNQTRQDYLQAQLLATAIREEMADTAAPHSEDYDKLLTQAATEYGEIYEKYRTRLAGLYARMYQGRCFQKMNKLADALSYYEELLEQPDDPSAFRDLKTKVMALALDCWCHDSQKKYAVAVAQGAAWVEKARPVEARRDDWMELRLKVAEAYRLYSEYLKSEAPGDANINRAISESRKLATYVAKYQGPYQKDGQRMAALLRGADIDPEAEVEPTTFTEARVAGKNALDAITTSNLILKMVPPRLKAEKDEAERKNLQKQIDDAQKSIVTSRQKARRMFTKALELVDDETKLEDLSVVYYFLSYLHYTDGNYYDAALLGNFVARRDPGSAGARPCAKIAMASYLKLFAENETDDKSYETDQIIDVAEYITKKWPQESEAIDAYNTLISFMIQRNELDKAREYLMKIPEDSDKRGKSELKTGQAMWSAYLTGMAELREDAGEQGAVEETPELAQLKTQAQTILDDGINRMKKAGAVDETMATAVLSLAQIYVDTEQPLKAVSLLEEPAVGSLTLLGKKHPATTKTGFAEEAYKTALRAYIAASAAGGDANASLDKAKGVMASLKQAAGSTPAGQKKLIAIYISLANDLKEQMKLIQSPETKKALTNGYAEFLRQVGADSDELNVLNWVAETFASMAQTMSPAEAKPYFTEAVSTYQKVLARGEKDPKWLAPEIETQVQMRLAMTYRQMGQYKGAMDILEKMLVAKPMTLSLQVEAAKTYQEWAKLPGKEGLYERAVKGGRPNKDGKNSVWGWIRMSQILGRYEKFRDVFYEARYNLSIAHYQHALRLKGDNKKKYLNYAKRDIENTQLLYPDMGGEKWRPKFDTHLRKIQQALNEKVVGLAPLKQASTKK